LQVPALQVLPVYLWQAPAPSQKPSSPQVETSDFGQLESVRGCAPGGRLMHVPGLAVVVDEQVWQPPVQAVSQQTFSTQNPLPHCPSH
jgi:hypothetical protein